jgi:copper oxidase (laccase) domain-containing protein
MLRGGGALPADLAVTLGPGIGSCCYAVDEERFARFLRVFGEGSVRRWQGRPFLDLQGANLEILRRAGVEDVAVVRSCTACTPALASFRRDGPSFAHMLAFVGRVRS